MEGQTRRGTNPPAPASALLPLGAQWRRAEEQLAMRLGGFPGDHVALLAPASHDPSMHLAQRLPRIAWLQLGDGDRFGWHGTAPGFTRLRADILDPPLDAECLDAAVFVFSVPLLTPDEHTELVAAWRNTLAWYGKWLELVATKTVTDPRLKSAEADLKRAGFTRVRTQRLALGRMGAQLVLLTARRGDEEDADEDDEEERDEE